MNKLVTLGAVAALSMGGQAYAQLASGGQCPTTPVTVGEIDSTPGFNCTLGDKVLSGWALISSDQTMLNSTSVAFGLQGSNPAVTFSNGSGSYPTPGTNTLIFDVAIAPGHPNTTISGVTLTADVTDTVTNLLSIARVDNGSGVSAPFLTGAGTVSTPLLNATTLTAVRDVLGTPTDSTVTSVTEVFTQRVSTPEPMSLSLFGLGLAGLALARRRRS